MPGRSIKDRIRKMFHRCEDHLVGAGETSVTLYYICSICGKRIPVKKEGPFLPSDIGRTNGRM